jgi:hypothetical protein
MAKVITGKVRFSYVNVFQPKVNDSGASKYSMMVLVPKTDSITINKIKKAVEEVKTDPKAKTKWGGKIPANLKLPLRDGDDEFPEKEEYKGMYFFNCSSDFKPNVVDVDCEPIMDSTEIYSGCWGRVSVVFYAYSNTGNKGIAAGLNNIQKLEDGESLTGRSSAKDDFSENLL